MDEPKLTNNNFDENNDIDVVTDISYEQIKDMFNDIVELPDTYFIAAVSTASKHCHNARC